MSNKANHHCIVCGRAYHACDNCMQIKTYTPWRAVCDSWDHYQIYMLLRSFQMGLEDTPQILSSLKRLGVSETSYADWPEGTKKLLNQIFSSAKHD